MPGNQIACFSYRAAFQWWQCGDGTPHTAHLQQLLGAGCTVPKVTYALMDLSTGWIRCELIQRSTKTCCHSSFRSPREIHRRFRLTGAEASIKIRRLSLNLSLALRRKKPRQEPLWVFCFCFFFFASRHTCISLPED